MNPGELIAMLLLQAANDVPPSKVTILWLENGRQKIHITKQPGQTILEIPRKTFIESMICQPNPPQIQS